MKRAHSCQALFERDIRAFGLAYALLLPAFLAPLFVTRVLPGLDLPFHAALADMLGKAHRTASPYEGFYEPHLWPPPPALPWLVLALVAKVVSHARALHVVVGLYVATLPLSVAAFSRSLGGSATPAVLAFPLAYNLALHYGFLGYVLSLPVLFAVLALARAVMTVSNSRLALRSSVLALAACTLYGVHLETYVIGVVIVLAMALLTRSSRRARGSAALALAPSLLLAAYWHAATPYASGARRGLAAMLSALWAVRRAELGVRSFSSDVLTRLGGIHVHLLRGFHDGIDRTMSIVVLSLASAWLVFAVATWPAADRRDARSLLARFIAPVLALAAYALLPHHFDEYEAMSISPRLAPLFVLALVGALPVAHAAAGPRRELVQRVLFGASVICAFGYGIALRERYSRFSHEVADFEAVMSEVPAGERVIGLVFDGESRVMNIESVMRGLPTLYVGMQADARSMVALRYCGMRHIPCMLGPRARTLPNVNPFVPEEFDARAPANPFTIAIVRRPPAGPSLAGRPARVIALRGEWAALRWQ